MHKSKLLIFGMLLSSYIGIKAASITIPNYTEDFSTLSVAKPDMGLKGWSRIVDKHTINGSDYTVSYQSYTYSYGVKAPSVYCSTQKIGPYGKTEEANDILVTPKISGTLSFWAKAYSSTGTNSIRLFRCTLNDDGSFTAGDEIDLGEGNTVSYTAKRITVPGEFDNEYVGFRIDGCYLDDVSATSAEREEEKIFILNSASNTGGSSLTADQRNSVKLPVKVTLSNTGDLDFTQGDANYELYLHRGSSSTASSSTKIATVKLTDPLAVGATSVESNVVFSFSAANGSGNYFFVYDPDGNYKSLGYTTIKEYKPELKINRDQTGNYEFIPLDFGFTNPEDTRALTLKLKNIGSAPLNDLQCITSDNFSVSGIQPIASEGEIEVTVSLDATTPGWYEGAITFTGTNVTSQTIKVRGLIKDANIWTEDFEAESFPANFLVEGEYWKIGSTPTELATVGNSKWAQNSNSYSYSVTEFITPKLQVNEDDDPLQVFIGRIGSRTETKSNLKIKYSPDRINWTEVTSLQDASSNSPFGPDLISSVNASLFKRITVDNIPAGEWFIAFEGNYSNIAHITGYHLAEVDHDLMYVGHNIPNEGMVNYPLIATLKLKNMNSVPETDYSVTLYADDNAVATADATDFAAASEKEFTMTYYPHATGTSSMKIVFEAGDFKYESDPMEVTINAEVASEEKQIGTRGKSDFNTPVNAYYKHSHTEMIYNQSQLGLEPGSKIVSLTFIGYRTSQSSSADVNYTAYVSSDSREKLTTSAGFKNLEEMTKVKEGSVHFDASASYTSSIDYYTPLLKIEFDEPFTYEGGNLCVAFTSDASTTRKDVQYSLISGTSGQAMYGRSDSQATAELTPYSIGELPVLIIGTQKSVGLVSGKVCSSDSTPIEGAQVKFASGDVYYETVSDNEGNYSLEIMQLDRTYQISANAEGYEVYETAEPVTIEEGNSTINITMTPLPTAHVVVSGTVTDKHTGDAIKGASVVFECADRREEAEETDEDGNYSITIHNPGTEEWNVTVTATNYKQHLHSQVLTDNTPLHFILEKDGTVNIEEIENDCREWEYFDINGIKINDSLKLRPGIYIRINGTSVEKVLIKE